MIDVVFFDPHPIGDTPTKIRSAPNANRYPNLLLEVLVNIAKTNKRIPTPDHRAGDFRLGPVDKVSGANDAEPEVKMVRVETGDMLFGTIEAGEKEQTAPGGRPDEHTSETGFENAPWAVDAASIE